MSSSASTLEAPQGCVLSLLLFTLYRHVCTPRPQDSCTLKYPDTITIIIIGRLINNDKSLYHKEVDDLAEWCMKNNLQSNVSKTNELILEKRK